MKVEYIKQVGKIPVGRIAQVDRNRGEELVKEGVAVLYEGDLQDGKNKSNETEEEFLNKVNSTIKASEEEE